MGGRTNTVSDLGDMWSEQGERLALTTIIELALVALGSGRTLSLQLRLVVVNSRSRRESSAGAGGQQCCSAEKGLAGEHVARDWIDGSDGLGGEDDGEKQCDGH